MKARAMKETLEILCKYSDTDFGVGRAADLSGMVFWTSIPPEKINQEDLDRLRNLDVIYDADSWKYPSSIRVVDRTAE